MAHRRRSRSQGKSSSYALAKLKSSTGLSTGRAATALGGSVTAATIHLAKHPLVQTSVNKARKKGKTLLRSIPADKYLEQFKTK